MREMREMRDIDERDGCGREMRENDEMERGESC